MPLKKYTNNISSSSIAAVYTYLEAPKPRFFVEYKDNACAAHTLDQIIDFLNKSKNESSMALSDEIRQDISADSDNIISRQTDTGKYFFNDIPKLQSLHSKTLIEKPASTIDEEKFLSLSTTRIPWYKFQDNFDQIIKAAHNMLDENPGSRIFSLGQSPAWIVKAAEYIALPEQPQRKFGYIPFSGGFYYVIDDEKAELEFNPAQFKPTPYQEVQYRGILDEVGLNPKMIVESQQLRDTKTVILDFINTGKGLVSFLSILFSWAKQEGISVESMKSALDILLLVTSKEDKKNSLKFDDIKVECKNQIIEEIWTLANGVDSGIFSDRLIPNYPYAKWDKDPEPIIENAPFIKDLTNRMQVAYKAYLSSIPAINYEPTTSESDAIVPEISNNDEVNISGHSGDSGDSESV